VRINRTVAVGAVTAVMAALALPLLALPASAAGTPPWEPDPATNFGTSTTPDYGTLTFYNSAGQVVTSGTNLAHLFDYAEASTADPFAGTKATLYFAAPSFGEQPPSFFVSLASSSTAFPNPSAPAPLNTATDPVVTLASADADLSNFIASVPAQTQPGYADVFQIRLLTTGPGGVGSGPNGQYWDADVLVDPNAGTWTEVYPSAGTTTPATTTTLAASPAASAQQGSPVTLTATVTASDSTIPGGSIEFDQVFDGVATPLGSAAVDSTGVAALTTSGLLPSAPSGANAGELTATFTPTDSSSYTGSTSSPLAYTVNPVANAPAMAGPHQAGQRETCSDGTLDFGVAPSYTWLANGASIGTGSSLTVPGSAYKKTLACQVTVRDGTGPVSAPMTSTPVTVILGKALKPSKKPALSGSHKAGKVETVHSGTWPRGAKFTYQWLLNGKVIRHATKSTLRLTRSERGKKVSCRVTAHLAGFASGTATTSSVKVS